MTTAYISLEREMPPYDKINTLDEVNAALKKYTETMSRHTLMYKKADVNPLKGKRGGDCNVTQCQKPNAIMYNNGTHAWYCKSCAEDINFSCRHSDFFPLCIDEETKDEKDEGDRLADSLRKISTEIKRKGIEGFVNMKVEQVIRTGAKIGRNERCACGSGKKYKNCHGA